MNLGADDGHQREIVIIKRRPHSDGEGHHGGVWKIAYADFMTAMMAFFLVMWLINAANEETRSQVASYFNPVKLIDSRTNTKGLQDLETGASGKAKHQPPAEETTGKSETPAATGEKSAGEQGLKEPTAEPQAPAGPAPEDAHAEEPNAGALAHDSGRPGSRGGEAYLDPFDPQSWQQIANERATPEDPVQPIKQKEDAGEVKLAAHSAKAQAEHPKPTVQPTVPPDGAKPASNASFKGAADTKPTEQPDSDKPLAHPTAGSEPAEKKAQQIEQDIKAALGQSSSGVSPDIEVRSTQEGVLISLTDNTSFGMFDIASAEPQPELVHYMEEIGKVLQTRSGSIVISGHTDGRPFRSETYDNWKLSSARAQMAYYMLVRGGVDERRVEKIEGHADRDLKVPNNPEAAENRRIEILLRETKS